MAVFNDKLKAVSGLNAGAARSPNSFAVRTGCGETNR